MSMARLIDHTLLKPDATAEEIAQLCREAREYHFASVCVNSGWVPLASDLLKGSDVAVCTVVGFPLGASLPEVKAYEAQIAIQNGASEVDMVQNIGYLKSRDLKALHHDIATVVATCHAHNVICKVILETSKLTDEEKVIASQVSVMAGADFVKTSTGFGGGGATVHDVALMRRVVGPNVGVKASGGVRSYEDAQAMVKAGATRIGASAGVAIVRQERGEQVAVGGKGY
ncbi:MAG: deoxyribose-phosphate aldolase [Chloroflexi bacterium]|nr:MAG: deoxyribose-phosphate aldolase [Chloroflexota bacterium]